MLTVLIIFASALLPGAPRPRDLVIFRLRSRHTYGFEPAVFDLPQLELSALCNRRLQLSAAAAAEEAEPQVFWADGVSSDELAAASQRAILTHAAFSIVSSAPDVSGLPTDIGLPTDGTELRAEDVEIVDLAQPNIRRETRTELQLQLADALGRGSTRAGTAGPAKRWVLIRERGGRAHLGWRLATGPAAGLGAPGLASGRRCYTGWLGRYALKSRQAAGPTAMEPEIGFLMGNWARVRPGSRVLDPTCGSCGLLLAAAALGATELTGVDRNASAFDGVAADFTRLGLPPPRLATGDVTRPDATPSLLRAACGGMYDAIVCDPPYGMRAPVLIAEREPSSAEPGLRSAEPAPRSAEPAPRSPPDLSAAVLALAERSLAPGGRCVAFLPVRGAEVDVALPALLEARLPAHKRPSLTLIHGRLQRFSTRRSRRAGSASAPVGSRGPGAFARWLVCFEKSAAAREATGEATGEAASEAAGEATGEAAAASAPTARRQPSASVNRPTVDGLEPDGVADAVRAIGLCAADVDGCRRAVAIVDAMRPRSARMYAASAAMALCARAGEWRQAIGLVERLESADIACYHAALSACARAGRPAEAAALIAQMHPRHGVAPVAACYTSRGRAAMAAGDWAAALASFDELVAAGLSPAHADYKVAIEAATAGEQWARAAALVQGARGLGPRSAAKRAWLWRAWSGAKLRLVRAALERHVAVDLAATSALQRALTDAAAAGHLAGSSFSDAGARGGYTLSHLASRTLKVADVLRLDEPRPLRAAVRDALRHHDVISLGGGPGFDFAAVALVSAFESSAPHAPSGPRASSMHMPSAQAPRTLVLDFERGWRSECAAVEAAVRRALDCDRACDFGFVDITRPLTDEANGCLREALPAARLLVASYVVAENARALGDDGFRFFEELVGAMAPGTLLLVLETTHRSFPAIVRAAQRGVGVAAGEDAAHTAALQVACPWVGSNNGFSLVLRKLDGHVGDAVGDAVGDWPHRSGEVEALLERFERDSQVHGSQL